MYIISHDVFYKRNNFQNNSTSSVCDVSPLKSLVIRIMYFVKSV